MRNILYAVGVTVMVFGIMFTLASIRHYRMMPYCEWCGGQHSRHNCPEKPYRHRKTRR